MARTGCEEHEVCGRSPSTGREGDWTWVTMPDSQGQPSGMSGEREQGVTSFTAHFLASALTALKGVRSCTGPWVTGEEQILGLKSWEMLLQLLASHCQSQTTLHKAVAWAKNVFQKRALEKHLLAGDWLHLPDVSPPHFLSKQDPCCQEGTGDGEDCPAAL